jgi:hypothetical protein
MKVAGGQAIIAKAKAMPSVDRRRGKSAEKIAAAERTAIAELRARRQKPQRKRPAG